MSRSLDSNQRIDSLNGGLKIIQCSSAPCFALDAVLLADFVRGDTAGTIIDLGTGTGIIPLLLSRKFATAKICGIELMAQMQQMAEQSVALNALDERISIVAGDIKNISALLPKASADLVTANPPYYKIGHGRDNATPLRAAARQEQYCTLNDVLAAAGLVLRPLGKLYIVQRVERFGELMQLLPQHKLNPERIRFVQPRVDKEANLVLVEAKKMGQGKLCVEPALVVYEENGDYTKEMQEIYAR